MKKCLIPFLSLVLTACAPNLQNQNLAVIDTQLMALDLQNHDPQAARIHLDAAKSLAPNDAQVLVAQGYFAEQMGDLVEAKLAYQAAIAAGPNDPSIENDYGTFLYHQGEYAQALPYFEQAAANPDNAISAEAYENSGLAEQELGDQVAAQADFVRASREDPDL